MAYVPGSSFPQVPGVVPAQVQKKQTIQLYRVLAGSFLVLSILASVGMYFYKHYLDAKLIAVKGELVQKTQSNFSEDQKTINEIRVYDLKLRLAELLLNNHLSPTQFFTELERSTKQTVAIKNLEYSYNPGLDVLVGIQAFTRGLESVPLQRRQIIDDGIFSDFLVRDVVLQSSRRSSDLGSAGVEEDTRVVSQNGVEFKVSGVFDKRILAYSGLNQNINETSSFASTLSSTTASEFQGLINSSSSLSTSTSATSTTVNE